MRRSATACARRSTRCRCRRSLPSSGRNAAVDKLAIEGGTPLRGEIRASVAKNAALPLLCAAILSPEPLTLTNVPRLNDVRTMQSLLAQMGVALETSRSGAITLSAERIDWPLAPYEL